MKYIGLKWILNKQIELKSDARWCVVGKEFICVYQIIPKLADVLYTPKQLLKKLTNES